MYAEYNMLDFEELYVNSGLKQPINGMSYDILCRCPKTARICIWLKGFPSNEDPKILNSTSRALFLSGWPIGSQTA